ncbi:hypothetical protein DXG01_000003 [Tephrocybe rancida]|nr:hypothetical protein DXG01_000003 [Tephrocybe rancida]
MTTPNSIADIAAQVKFDILSKSHLLDNASKADEVARTFISDTVTVPTPEMYAYATLATIGDDVYYDPSTSALEAHMAQLTGKEAGLFIPSGTASNQIALRTHLRQPPYTVFAPTEVISLENTLNGTIFPQDDIIAISDYAHSHGIKMHLDGARIWHVAIETRTPLKELLAPFDTASLCFSKGLGAPIGSCLVGPKEFIAKARWFRKLFGGGMRQTGILAASAAYALTHNFPQLERVHALTKKLEAGLKAIGADITSGAETCMVFYDPSPLGLDYNEIAERASVLPSPLILGGSRLVLHIQTSEAAVDDFLSLISQLAEEKRKAGFVKPDTPVKVTGYKDIYERRVPKPKTN